MSLTRNQTKNTITQPVLASASRILRNFTSNRQEPRLILTGNKIFPKNRSKKVHNPFITSPIIFEREDNEKHLTDSWQVFGINSWQVDAKRLDKWFKNGTPANTMKEKHTQLTRANYYNFD